MAAEARSKPDYTRYCRRESCQGTPVGGRLLDDHNRCPRCGEITSPRYVPRD